MAAPETLSLVLVHHQPHDPHDISVSALGALHSRASAAKDLEVVAGPYGMTRDKGTARVAVLVKSSPKAIHECFKFWPRGWQVYTKAFDEEKLDEWMSQFMAADGGGNPGRFRDSDGYTRHR